jgi:flagellar assembly factor FliW
MVYKNHMSESSDEQKLELELLDKTLNFPFGIKGFENFKRFVLLRSTPNEKPFFNLQSLDDTNLTFTVLEPHALVPDYKANVKDTDLIPIGSPNSNEVGVLVVTKVQQTESGFQVEANLRAPIVINLAKKTATQVVLDDSHPYNHHAQFNF